MTLLEKCLGLLGKDAVEISDDIVQDILKIVPITFYGRVDWESVHNAQATDLIEIKKGFSSTKKWFIFWNDISLPVISCNYNNIIDNIDDVIPVSFDTWLISGDLKRIIEFYHGGEIKTGSLPRRVLADCFSLD